VWHRYPIKTELFANGDDYASKITQEVVLFRKRLLKNKSALGDNRWIVIVSEKIVAISQGRSYFIWDINPTFWAKTLSRFVTRTPYGIGLGSPWTMQLALNEVGLPRILCAAVASIVTKPFGLKGVFYRIAGRTVASIDGPTEYSLYPSNVSAKLGPKNPDKAAQKIRTVLESQLSLKERSLFDGVVIIDANDLGRDILGNATQFSDSDIAEIMRDNPMGQGSEQTPVVMAFKK
jgi:asparagine synthase (glutamine-hydrolysing)